MSARPGPSQSQRPGASQSQSQRAGASSQAQSQSSGGDNQLSDAIRFGMQSVTELCKDVLPLCNPEELKEVRKQLDAKFRMLVKAETVYGKSSDIVDTAFGELLQVEEDSDDRKILKALESFKNQVQQQRLVVEKKQTNAVIQRNQHYIEFDQIVKDIIEDLEINDSDSEDADELNSDAEQEGSDEETVSDMIPTIDPISKGLLKDPVRNKICGHIYGKRAMIELTKQNERIRCPQLGCDNKSFVKESDLQFDPILAQKVKRKLKKEIRQKRQNTQGNN